MVAEQRILTVSNKSSGQSKLQLSTFTRLSVAVEGRTTDAVVGANHIETTSILMAPERPVSTLVHI